MFLKKKIDTHECGEDEPSRSPQLPFTPYEDRVRGTVHAAKRVHAEVVRRADHVVPAHKQRPPNEAEHDGGEKCTNEALNGLFRRELDERRPAERYA